MTRIALLLAVTLMVVMVVANVAPAFAQQVEDLPEFDTDPGQDSPEEINPEDPGDGDHPRGDAG
jgi:hypothetical protein